MRHIHSFSKAIILALVLLCAASEVFAFQFSPLTQQFSVSGAEATRTYTVTNDSDEAIAVEVSALTRDQDALGNEVNKNAANYFSIQPAKAIIKPQSSLIIRVQYRGPKTVTRELSFRIKAEQVAYSQGRASTNQSMFNFLYIYNSSAYVAPSKVTERVVVTKTAAADDGQLAITLSNMGTVHQLLNDLVVNVQDGNGNMITITGVDALPGLSGSNLLAGKTVTKSIPWPEGLAKGSTYKATISYNYSATNV